MDAASWAPLYAMIRAEFGYDAKADEAARDLLDALLADKLPVDLAALRAQLAGQEAFVVGAAATVADLAAVPEGAPLVLTDGAAEELLPWRRPTAIVTDLDGDVGAQALGNALGVPVFVHAHGDNLDALRLHVPRFAGPLQGTTQVAPRGHVAGYGGFTDGDRAACIAVELGAASLALVGFDFERPVAKAGGDPALKRGKLAWAKRIIEGLGVPVRHVLRT